MKAKITLLTHTLSCIIIALKYVKKWTLNFKIPKLIDATDPHSTANIQLPIIGG